MNNTVFTRTKDALGEELMTQIENHKFCIVGCGGTGALFAEMLVRSGAQKISLVDGDRVDKSNLNRIPSFVQDDIKKLKVCVLKSRLKKINPNIEVTSVGCRFRDHDNNDPEGQKARDAVYNSDIVIIAVDENRDRILCECFCNDSGKEKTLSIGVHIYAEGHAEYECAWRPKTPKCKKNAAGYGVGSYASIVIEAAATAFSILLHNLANPNSKKYNYFYKSYENFVPTCMTTKP